MSFSSNASSHANPIAYDDAKTLMHRGAPALFEHVATRLEMSLGQPLVQMPIRFRHLSLAADAVMAKDKVTGEDDDDHHHHYSRRELPTLFNELKKAVARLGVKKQIVRKDILKDLNGVFRPGTMTLIMGQPGSGKSALMKVLSGRFRVSKNVQLTGEIHYNGVAREQLLSKLPQLVTYVHQRDHHYPTLTVKETFEFAHKCAGAHDLPRELEALFVHGTAEENHEALAAVRALMQHAPEVVIQYLGLDMCQDTVVGNAMIRGISGGERKRVTTGEMEFTRSYATFMDEITTGLDSAAAYDIIKTERSIAKSLRKTVVISLLQPPPEVYELFDEVMMLNEGEVMYHGPREKAVSYFESLGFVRSAERDEADFLMDLGTNMQHQYQVALPAHSFESNVHPRHPSEFAEVFRRSEIYQGMIGELDKQMCIVSNDGERIRQKPAFSQSIWDSTATLVHRELKIMGRNKPFLMGRAMMVVIMGLLYSSVFYQFDPTNVVVVVGIVFASILFTSLSQLTQIPAIMEAREIFYRQRGSNFYRTWSYVFAFTVSRIPSGLAESLVFGTLIYWMCGFVARADSFIIFEVLLFLSNLVFGSWFFLVTTIAPDLHVAKPAALISISLFILSAGFVISPHDMPVYFVWLYWINPIAWSFRGMAINEYMSDELNVAVYKGVDYEKKSICGMSMGKCMLHTVGIKTQKEWIWYGMVYLVVCYFGFVVLSFLSLEFLRFEHDDHSHVVKKKEKQGSEDYVIVETPKKIIGSLQEGGFTSGSDEVAISMPVRSRNFVPVTLAFQNLWYTVPLPGGNKGETIDLLKGVSGFAFPGKMTALMGSSGAGKTTLMDVIAGRKNSGVIRGKILMNGREANELAIRRATGYCEQMDVHSEASTIREALTFSAFLRQGSDIPDSAKYDSVEECLELLGLGPIADKIIRGSSVEQMKRLTIGVELAAQPSVLFLDEPTSGLDARSAKLIMDGVRKVADTGRTVVCTIHQPSSEVFFLFDSLLLLKRGGETAFFGELGAKAVNLVNYFESIPNVKKCPEEYNPATWMLEVIGAGVGNDTADDKDFVTVFNESGLRSEMERLLSQEGVSRPGSDVDELVFRKKRAASEGLQARMLLKRFVDLYWRTPSYNLTRMFVAVLQGLLFGLIYLHSTFTTFSGIHSGVGMMFMISIFTSVVASNSVLPLMAEQRASFYRERACQTYNSLWYFVGTTVSEIPYVGMSSLLFASIFFPMAGFKGVVTFILFWIMVWLLALTQTYVGQLLAFATPSIQVAATFVVLLNSICFLFMGFNPPASAIPSGYKWLYQLIPQRYPLSFLVALVFCNDDLGAQRLKNAPIKYANYTVKQYVEEVFNMRHDHMWRDFGITLVFLVGLRLLAAFALRYLSFQKR